ncbi:hypothetical protein BDQ17DRAFT_130871 [Cyathus striatus]|nr:hypothetical protein BDQ17DRAFT_130871 [Cyathus striatus]
MSDALKLVILLGQTGVGKSSFINTLAGKDVMEVNDTITSNENDTVRYYIWSEQGIVLVDTPGFNPSNQSRLYDQPIHDLQQWLHKPDPKTLEELKNAKFGAILYLFQNDQLDFPLLNQIQKNFPADRVIYVLSNCIGQGFRRGKLPPYKNYENTKKSAKKIMDFVPSDGVDTARLKSFLKAVRKSKNKRSFFEGIHMSSRIVILLGQAGVGKSSVSLFYSHFCISFSHKWKFINTLIGIDFMKVNHSITSGDDTISYDTWNSSTGQHIVLVDTPGFNSTSEDYYKPLHDLLQWLNKL